MIAARLFQLNIESTAPVNVALRAITIKTTTIKG